MYQMCKINMKLIIKIMDVMIKSGLHLTAIKTVALEAVMVTKS